MKKRILYALSIIILAALAAGYFTLHAAESLEKTGRLYPIDQRDIVSFTVENTYGVFLFTHPEQCADASEGWMIENEGKHYRSNAEKLKLMLTGLSDLPVRRELPGEKEEYGLRTPAARVQFTLSSGETGEAVFGRVGTNAAETYAKDVDSDTVILTDTGTAEQWLGSLAAYRNKEVFLIDPLKTRELSYWQNGALCVKVSNKTTEEWFMEYPWEAPARHIELNELIAGMKNWTIAGFPEEELTPAQMGLEQPREALELVDTDGNTQRITFGNVDGTGRYAQIGGIDDVVLLYAADVDLTGMTPDKLLFVTPLRATLDETASLTINADGRMFVYDRSADTGTVELNGSVVTEEDFTRVFYKVISLVASGKGEPPDVGARVSLSVALTLRDGTMKQLEIMERDEDTCYMRINGADTGYYLDKSRIDGLLERIDK